MAFWGKKKPTDTPPVDAPEPVAAAPVVEPGTSSASVSSNAPGTTSAPQVATSEPAAKATQRQAAMTAQLMSRLGEIVLVLMRSQQHRSLPLAQLESLVLPPLMRGQVLVAQAQSKSQGTVVPIAAALWAQVSEAVDKRLSEDLDKPLLLAPDEWKSGDIPWLIALVGDNRLIAPMVKELQRSALQGRPLKIRIKDASGKSAIGLYSGDAPST
jgi:cytolysin-activating lysine-acyltransferase